MVEILGDELFCEIEALAQREEGENLPGRQVAFGFLIELESLEELLGAGCVGGVIGIVVLGKGERDLLAAGGGGVISSSSTKPIASATSIKRATSLPTP